ncbi:PREDICTED: lipase member H-A-like [Dinoponera quadriceps]|uniref:phospholipase A1 n=1 Tax=Dinoponera quadriceps TaxID=609295 RepID=A0A6P3XXP1_DINQU|nr:PREDICTED: lipase member H-A-like [Dinoponera quadriceps]
MIRASRQFVLAFIVIFATADERMEVVENLESVFLRFYTGTTIDKYVDYSLDNARALQTKLIDDRRTVLYIHGFSEHLEKESVQTIVQAYLKRNDHNIIAVSYAELANESYTKVVMSTAPIGAALALVLDNMVQTGFDPEKLYIVGHSMGGQIAGYVGRKVSFQLSRITGLDPAGPLFNILVPHLSSSDARFVDIIHTDYGFYGIGRNTGTVDFFPNGGTRVQPGCPKNFTFYSTEGMHDASSKHRSG